MRERVRVTAGIRFDSSTLHSIGDQLVGEWTFGMLAVGGITYDTSGNGKNGTITGAATTTGYNGKTAYSFNGSTDFITIPYGWTVANQSFTTTAWVYDAGSGANEIIFDGGTAASVSRISMRVWTNGLGCTTNNNGIGSGGSVAKNTWVHVACSFNSSDGTMKGYINGVQTFSTAEDAPNLDPIEMRIASRANAPVGITFLTGYVDDVRIYSSALSASEIQKLYAEGKDLHNLANK
ncbi:MAG: LamG domain-containing protein [archaeon]